MSFPAVDGVGIILEEGGETERSGDSALGAFDVDGRRDFFCPGPPGPLESCA